MLRRDSRKRRIENRQVLGSHYRWLWEARNPGETWDYAAWSDTILKECYQEFPVRDLCYTKSPMWDYLSKTDIDIYNEPVPLPRRTCDINRSLYGSLPSADLEVGKS